MSCQARVLHEYFIIPDSTEICYTSKECGKPEYRKISVDDGEGTMPICSTCYPRYRNMLKKPDTWYGWFDCEYPPEARIKWSKWYTDTVFKIASEKLLSATSDTIVAGVAAINLSSELQVPALQIKKTKKGITCIIKPSA